MVVLMIWITRESKIIFGGRPVQKPYAARDLISYLLKPKINKKCYISIMDSRAKIKL